MDIKSRTYLFVKHKGLTMKKFEELCGLSSGYVSSMRKGFGRGKLDNVLTTFPDLNREWLLYGEGEMLVSETPTEEKIEEISPAVPAVNECLDCRILQVRLEEKQATIDSLREQLDQAQDANRELLALLKQTIVPVESEHQKKKII